MDEFGDTPNIYVWPKDHEEGSALPDDFWERVSRALKAEGLEWERV